MGWFSAVAGRGECNLRQTKTLLLRYKRRISAWRRYAIDPAAFVIGSVFDHAELADNQKATFDIEPGRDGREAAVNIALA